MSSAIRTAAYAGWAPERPNKPVFAMFADDTADEHNALTRLGVDFRVITPTSQDEMVKSLAGVDAVFNYWGVFDRPLLSRLDDLKLIVYPGSGYDRIDVNAATDKGIAVVSLPFNNVEEVANHTMAMLLALNRKLFESVAHARRGEWDPSALLPIGPLLGETLGLLGFGLRSREVAKRAQAFGMNVVAYDPYVAKDMGVLARVPLLDLDEVLERSDYIACLIPLSDQTKHFIRKEHFARMKTSALFVNMSRGKVVDEAALLEALDSGQISAAALDVLEVEPPDPKTPLLHHPKVIVTPHSGGQSDAYPARRRRQAIEVMTLAAQGIRPPGLINPQAWRIGT